jgi:putative FmdB family regulatory protein
VPLYDFRCPSGHTNALLVPYSERNEQVCPDCGEIAKQVWLTAPKLDWSGMAMGANAGPEFIDRFEKSRKKRREQERKHKEEHGDSMRGAGS